MLKPFDHVQARTVDEAVDILRSANGSARLIAGGTDLLGVLKDRILPDYPRTIIDLKTVPGLAGIEADGRGLTLGALTRLTDIVRSPVIRYDFPILARAAESIASPQIRNLATIGGNLTQDVRCPYYRYPHQIGGRVLCFRKGSGPCLAIKGDNRYGAILGAKGCFAVCPSDMAMALAALKAEVRIKGFQSERAVPVADLYGSAGLTLQPAEVVTGISVPPPTEGERAVFLKFRLRESVDFAVVSVAAAIVLADGLAREARIVLGAVGPAPVRAAQAEEFLTGRPITKGAAKEAADLALEGARPLSMNGYKVDIARTLVRQAVLAMGKKFPD